MTNKVEEMSKYKVWECKIIVSGDAELPSGFDFPPRMAAMMAVESAGIEVIACSSGWGGTLSKSDERIIDDRIASKEKAS